MCATQDNKLGGFLRQYGIASKPGKSMGLTSSGGIGFGMPATSKAQPTRMQRTASSANFMALFGPQAGA